MNSNSITLFINIDNLRNLCVLSLTSLVIILLINLAFSNVIIASFKTHAINQVAVSVLTIMCELSEKSKNYYCMSNASF